MANRLAGTGLTIKNFTENPELADSDGKTMEKCNSPEEITDYFFRVYGQNKKNAAPRTHDRTIAKKRLDEMIKYQFLNYPKSREVQYKTDRNVCQRKEVSNSCLKNKIQKQMKNLISVIFIKIL